MSHDLDIVIVNWNSGNQLRDCLNSIVMAKQEGVCLQKVVIVDNDSHDESLVGVESIELPIHLIRNKLNHGFGCACNQGAAGSSSEFLLFLNPDTILNENSLVAAVDFMNSPGQEFLGVLGIRLFDENGATSRTCAIFPTVWTFLTKSLGLNSFLPRIFSSYIMDAWDHESSREVDHVIGAFYLVRRDLFKSLSGFDERFFVYLEDLDFSLRVRQAGFRSYYLADVSAFHRGGGVSDQIKAARLFYSLRSRIIYANKHFSRMQALLVGVSTLVIEPITRLIRAMARCSAAQFAETCGGYRMLWSDAAKHFRR